MLNRTFVLFTLIFFNVFLPKNTTEPAVPIQQPVLIPSCLSCSTFPKALSTAIISSKCSTLSPEQICVANSPVSVDYASSGQSSTPTRPKITYADQFPLVNFSSIVTNAIDLDSAKWGVAFVKVQAFESNVAMKLPLSLIMYGDAHLLAEVPDAAAQPSVTPNVVACTGTTTRGTYLRSKPGNAAQQIQFLQSSTSVTVFGRSSDGWLLADNHGTTGWIYAPVMKLSCAVADLPLFQPDDRSTALVKTPVTLPTLPALRFFSGSAAICGSVPTGGMLIQVPSTYYATLVIDGVHITATNTLINVEAQSSQSLTISVLQGKATIEATGKQSIVGSGQQVSVSLAGSDGLNPNSVPTNPIATRLEPKMVNEMCAIAHDLGLNLPCGQTIQYSVGSTAIPPAPASGTAIPQVVTNCTFTVHQFSTDQNPVELSRSFSGAPACVSTTLRWNIEGVQTAMLDGRPIGNQGAVSVCTNHTQTYTLTLVCNGETRTVSYTLDAVIR